MESVMRHSQQTTAATDPRTQTEQLPASFSFGGRDNARVLRLKQVAAIVGLGKSSIYCEVREGTLGTFPSPIKLGSVRASGWISTEVYDWIDDRNGAAKSHSAPRERQINHAMWVSAWVAVEYSGILFLDQQLT